MQIEQLGLDNQILTTSKDAPAARNRFIYYPNQIVRMPHPSDGLLSIGRTLLTHEVFSGLSSSIYNDLMSSPGRPASLQDESVGDFISRRFHPSLADNLVSAVLHGIYAGDIYSLSAKSLLPTLWEAEALGKDLGSVLWGLWDMRSKGSYQLRTDVDLVAKLQRGYHKKNGSSVGGESAAQVQLASGIKNSSVFTLRGGLGQLSDELVKALKSHKNVTIRTNCYVQKISQVVDKEQNEIKVNSDILNYFPQHLIPFPIATSRVSKQRQSSHSPAAHSHHQYYRQQPPPESHRRPQDCHDRQNPFCNCDGREPLLPNA